MTRYDEPDPWLLLSRPRSPAPLNRHWTPISEAQEGEPAPFECNGVLMVMTVRFDEGVYFWRERVD